MSLLAVGQAVCIHVIYTGRVALFVYEWNKVLHSAGEAGVGLGQDLFVGVKALGATLGCKGQYGAVEMGSGT